MGLIPKSVAGADYRSSGAKSGLAIGNRFSTARRSAETADETTPLNASANGRTQILT
jgi:hypothetical protein